MGGGRPGRPADTAAITVPTSIRQPREPAAAPLTGRLPWILIRQTVQVNIMTAELGPPAGGARRTTCGAASLPGAVDVQPAAAITR